MLFDPYHGVQDLQARLLRHVTDSFREDPVRILRVGPALRRVLPTSPWHPETMQLMREMVEHGEVTTWCPSACGRSWRAA